MTDDLAGESASGTDKSTIGATKSGEEVLTRLVDEGHFKTGIAAFQAAAMLALALDLPRPDSSEKTGTKWGTGSITQTLAFLEWYVPSTTPARELESLGEAGLIYLAAKSQAGYRLSELFNLASSDLD